MQPLLSDIFKRVLYDLHECSACVRAWETLALVCKSWRAAALATPVSLELSEPQHLSDAACSWLQRVPVEAFVLARSLAFSAELNQRAAHLLAADAFQRQSLLLRTLIGAGSTELCARFCHLSEVALAFPQGSAARQSESLAPLALLPKLSCLTLSGARSRNTHPPGSARSRARATAVPRPCRPLWEPGHSAPAHHAPPPHAQVLLAAPWPPARLLAGALGGGGGGIQTPSCAPCSSNYNDAFLLALALPPGVSKLDALTLKGHAVVRARCLTHGHPARVKALAHCAAAAAQHVSRTQAVDWVDLCQRVRALTLVGEMLVLGVGPVNAASGGLRSLEEMQVGKTLGVVGGCSTGKWAARPQMLVPLACPAGAALLAFWRGHRQGHRVSRGEVHVIERVARARR